MKSNPALQANIGLSQQAQRAYYAAHVLKSALVSSPPVVISAAVPAIPAKPAVIAQTAKTARAATPAVAASANTTGYGFGELYLNSPAYPAGTAIPAITAKPASAAVVGSAAVVAVPAIAAVTSPAVIALKGWDDEIVIERGTNAITITAELPVLTGVGLVGSDKVVIGEITPAALQANAWVDGLINPNSPLGTDKASDTLEQYFYTHALQCEHVLADIVRQVNGIAVACKQIAITIYPYTDFNYASSKPQVMKVGYAANPGS
jgi:hypothetical protein